MPRGTQAIDQSRPPFAYGAITLFGGPFQGPSASGTVYDSVGSEWRPPSMLPTPGAQRPHACTRAGFGLFPFRSPLLGE